MYGWRKLPSREFELPEDPYEDSPEGRRAQMILQKLGIFYYRDDRHGQRGIVIEPRPNEPIRAFYFQLIMDDEEMRVSEFDPPNPQTVAKYGDAKAWIFHNKQCNVIDLTEDTVKVQM